MGLLKFRNDRVELIVTQAIAKIGFEVGAELCVARSRTQNADERLQKSQRKSAVIGPLIAGRI
jgi:hypothetical protein